MRLHNLLEKRYPRTPSPQDLAAASAAGFDTTKLWFHGSGRKFDAFKLRDPDKGGIDELGPGIYLTNEKWLANAWAREKGVIVTCVVRQGKYFDLGKDVGSSAVQAILRQGYATAQNTKWGSKLGTAGSERETQAAWQRAWSANHGSQSLINLCLAHAGYVGAFKKNSQIPGQVVVFKSEDVLIVARQSGQSGMGPND